MKIDYWLAHTGLDRQAFAEDLRDPSIAIGPERSKIPTGALRKAQARYGRTLSASLPESFGDRAASLSSSSPPLESLAWRIVGAGREIHHLSEVEVKEIHDTIAAESAADADPIFPARAKNEGLLGSALHRPQTSLGGVLKYLTVEMAGAALAHSLILKHPFRNGNKRTGLVCLFAFLDRNSLIPHCVDDELFGLYFVSLSTD